jgi:alpha-galactosidase
MSTEETNFFALHGTNCSLILEAAETKVPIWRYWGPRLTEGTVPPFALADELSVPTFSLDQNVPLTMFPSFGVGWYGAPALLAHRGGQDFTQHFARSEVMWALQGKNLVVSLFDDVAALRVDINLALDSVSDTLTYQTRLTNLGEHTLDILWLAAACLPIPADAKSARYYTGRHNHEFELCEDVLSRATWLRENRRGLTSHDCVPGAVITLPGTTPHVGPTYGAQLAWSGNHAQRLDFTGDGQYQWQMGEWLAPGEVRLEKGQCLQSPDVLATFSPNGLNGVAQNFHKAVRARMNWPSDTMKPRPVHLNTWEGVYFDLEHGSLVDMATSAADLGVERFILDDGWFQGRRDDRAGLGDWWVDKTVFPEGLLPLARHVTELGMEFGLWIEPEMVNPNSDLFRAHPDWPLQVAGRPLLTARNQLVLDLTKPDVFTYLLGHIGNLLHSLPISYLKWDHNRDLTTTGSRGLPAYRGQVLAAYRLFDAVRKGWPDVEIEACAGGGGRIDAGILQHTHRVWTSDCIDAVSRIAIQSGFLQFFPPEIMGSHIGTSPAHTTGRQQAMDFRGGVALGGHLGIELDPRHLSAVHKDKIRAWVNIYKHVRDRLHSGRVWQGQTSDGTFWIAQGEVNDCIVSVYRVAPTSLRHPSPLALPFLDPQRRYNIGWLAPRSPDQTKDSVLYKALIEGCVNSSGAWLAQKGLMLPPLKGEAAIILEIKAV